MRALPVLLLVALCGCGKPALYPAEGVVKIDGAPAANARVHFWPAAENANPPASRIGVGFCDADGKFTITNGAGEAGLEYGEYAVTFSRVAVKGRTLRPDQREDGAVELVPMPYCDHQSPRNSPTRAKVDGKQSFAFDVPAK